MTQSARLLAAVRDAADVTGAAQPADLLTHAGMDRDALVRAIGDLAALGLVAIDRESGAVSLTSTGRAALASEQPSPEIDTGPKAQPAGYALAGAAPDARPPAPSSDLTPGLGSAPQPPLAAGRSPVIADIATEVPALAPGTEPLLGTPAGQAIEAPASTPPGSEDPAGTPATVVEQITDVVVTARDAALAAATGAVAAVGRKVAAVRAAARERSARNTTLRKSARRIAAKAAAKRTEDKAAAPATPTKPAAASKAGPGSGVKPIDAGAVPAASQKTPSQRQPSQAPRPPALGRAATEAAIKQARDVAIAAIKRRAAQEVPRTPRGPRTDRAAEPTRAGATSVKRPRRAAQGTAVRKPLPKAKAAAPASKTKRIVAKAPRKKVVRTSTQRRRGRKRS